MGRMVVQSRRRSLANLERDFPAAIVIDVTSKAEAPWVRFSPFFPHGGIPIPFTPERLAQSVEGVWQSLKVFANSDVDPSKLEIRTMKGLKRTIRKHGKCLGHRKGLSGKRLLGYLEARKQIYLPTYEWVLQNRLAKEVAELRRLVAKTDVVLLDYETNVDVENLAKPLSHAGLVAAYLTSTRGEEASRS